MSKEHQTISKKESPTNPNLGLRRRNRNALNRTRTGTQTLTGKLSRVQGDQSSAACFFFPPFSLSLDPSRLRLKLPDPTPLSLNAPEWSSAGVTDTACLELTQPIPAHYNNHPIGPKIGTGHGSTRKIWSNFLDPS